MMSSRDFGRMLTSSSDMSSPAHTSASSFDTDDDTDGAVRGLELRLRRRF